MAQLIVTHVRHPREDPALLETAVGSVKIIGYDPMCGCLCCHGGGRSVMQPPPGALVPLQFVDIYTADEWAAFASRLNSILDWSHAPLCPCGLTIILYCCALFACEECRQSRVTKLLAKENQRLRDQAVEWIFTPYALTITLRWEPLTRPAWEAAHPQRRKLTLEVPNRPDVDETGLRLHVKPAAQSNAANGSGDPVIVPGGPSPPPFDPASGSAVTLHPMAAPSAPPPPPYQASMEQQEGAPNAMRAIPTATPGDDPTFADFSSAPGKKL